MTTVELTCAEAWREISEMIDGTLDKAMTQRMEQHLSHCAHCKAVYDGTLNTVRLIGDDRIEDGFDLPRDFGERLFNRLSAECHG